MLSDSPKTPKSHPAETVRKVGIEPLVFGLSFRVRGYLSSHLCNLRKSADESMVRDSNTTHPQITHITQMRKPEPTLYADPVDNNNGKASGSCVGWT